MKFKLLLLFLILFQSIILAQNKGLILGKVKDVNGNVLPGASVVLKGTVTGAESDDKGMYVVENVEPGSYTLQATFIGFMPSIRKATVKSGEKTFVNFYLIEDTYSLQTTVFYGEKDSTIIKKYHIMRFFDDSPADFSISQLEEKEPTQENIDPKVGFWERLFYNLFH